MREYTSDEFSIQDYPKQIAAQILEHSGDLVKQLSILSDQEMGPIFATEILGILQSVDAESIHPLIVKALKRLEGGEDPLVVVNSLQKETKEKIGKHVSLEGVGEHQTAA